MEPEEQSSTPSAPPAPSPAAGGRVGRRRWIFGALAAAGAGVLAWVTSRASGRAGGGPERGAAAFDHEPTTLEAVLEQLLPSAAGMPSAAEAKVAAYVEAELAKPEFAVPSRVIDQAMKSFEKAAAARGAKRFADLDAQAQRELLAAFASGTLTPRAKGEAAVFQTMFSLALEGYLGAPSHGGNANGVAWRAIGFDAACQLVHAAPVKAP